MGDAISHVVNLMPRNDKGISGDERSLRRNGIVDDPRKSAQRNVERPR